jgi:hypothetical protein
MILFYGLIIVVFLAATVFGPDFINMKNKNLSLETRAAAAQRIQALHIRVWPAVIALICLLGIHSFRIFLRFIGPLYRFRWAFAKISRGEMNFQVRLREKDYLTQEAKMFNEMIKVITEKWGGMQKLSLDALKSLEILEESVAKMSGWQDLNRELLKAHRKLLENLVDKTRYFELKTPEGEKQKARS